MTSGWQGAPYFGRHSPELVSEPAISFEKKWGDYRRTTQGLEQFANGTKKQTVLIRYVFVTDAHAVFFSYSNKNK